MPDASQAADAHDSTGFFACYLLTPKLVPKRLRCTYVGFTVSPARRLRQHNGEIGGGAWRTRKHRPWEMVAVVHGFASKFHALQFEYAWQHPYNSRFSKQRLCALKGRKGVGAPRSLKRKLIELHELLQVEPWALLPLTVSYTSESAHNVARTCGYYAACYVTKHETRALSTFAALDRQAAAAARTRRRQQTARSDGVDALTCAVCELALSCGVDGSASEPRRVRCYHAHCAMQCHVQCLVDHFAALQSIAGSGGSADDSSSDSNDNEADSSDVGEVAAAGRSSSRRERGACPDCQQPLRWSLLVEQSSMSDQQQSRVGLDSSTAVQGSESSDSTTRTVESTDRDTSSSRIGAASGHSSSSSGVRSSRAAAQSRRRVTSHVVAVVIDLTIDDD